MNGSLDIERPAGTGHAQHKQILRLNRQRVKY